MEPIICKGLTMRAILPLLKARVTKRDATSFTMSFGWEHGSPTAIKVDCPMQMYDLRDGDLLTLYTEVPFAQPSQPPKQ